LLQQLYQEELYRIPLTLHIQHISATEELPLFRMGNRGILENTTFLYDKIRIVLKTARSATFTAINSAMRIFAKNYHDREFGQGELAQITWYHNIAIFVGPHRFRRTLQLDALSKTPGNGGSCLFFF